MQRAHQPTSTLIAAAAVALCLSACGGSHGGSSSAPPAGKNPAPNADGSGTGTGSDAAAPAAPGGPAASDPAPGSPQVVAPVDPGVLGAEAVAKKETTYDANGKIVAVLTRSGTDTVTESFDPDTGESTGKSISRETVDASKALSTEITLSVDLATGTEKETMRTETRHDATGCETSIYGTISSGIVVRDEVLTCDAKGNDLTLATLGRDGDLESLVTKTYDDKGRELSSETTDGDGKVTARTTTDYVARTRHEERFGATHTDTLQTYAYDIEGISDESYLVSSKMVETSAAADATVLQSEQLTGACTEADGKRQCSSETKDVLSGKVLETATSTSTVVTFVLGNLSQNAWMPAVADRHSFRFDGIDHETKTTISFNDKGRMVDLEMVDSVAGSDNLNHMTYDASGLHLTSMTSSDKGAVTGQTIYEY